MIIVVVSTSWLYDLQNESVFPPFPLPAVFQGGWSWLRHKEASGGAAYSLFRRDWDWTRQKRADDRVEVVTPIQRLPPHSRCTSPGSILVVKYIDISKTQDNDCWEI